MQYQKIEQSNKEENLSRDILKENEGNDLKEELEQELKGLSEEIIRPYGIS